MDMRFLESFAVFLNSKDRKYFIVKFFLIFLMGLICYFNSFKVPFVFDDIGYIKSNPAIFDIKDIKAIWEFIPARFVGMLTFALNYHFNQENIFGYHLVNLTIHVFNAFLVWAIIRALFQTPKLINDDLQSKKELIAFSVAVIFIIHPIQIQAVTYITQRLASLATFFYFITIFFYLKIRIHNKRIYLIVAVVSAVLGALTKQIVLSLPVMVLMIELFFFQKNWSIFKKAKINKAYVIIIILLVLIIPAIYSFNFKSILSMTVESGSKKGEILNAGNYFLTQMRVVATYLRLLIFPIGQNLLYDFSISKSIFEFKTIASLIGHVILIFIGIINFRKNVLIAFGILWFYIALSVESSFIVIKHVIFEHRMYLPSFGLILAFTVFLIGQLRSLKKYVVVFLILIMILSFLTIQRNKIWQSEISLWQDGIKKSPKQSRAFMNLAIAYMQLKNYSKATEYLTKAILIDPVNVDAYNNRGITYFFSGKLEDSLVDFNAAIKIDPNDPNSYFNRANYFSSNKNSQKAIEDFTQTIKLKHNFFEAYLKRGNEYAQIKNYELALADFNKAVEIDNNNEKLIYDRGNILAVMGKYDLALEDYNKVIKMDSKHARAFEKRSKINFIKKNYFQALKDISEAKALGLDVNEQYIKQLGNYISQ